MEMSKVFGYSGVAAPRSSAIEDFERLRVVEAEKYIHICKSTVLSTARQAEMIDPFIHQEG
jgi:hypothetical protein